MQLYTTDDKLKYYCDDENSIPIRDDDVELLGEFVDLIFEINYRIGLKQEDIVPI